MQDVSYEWLESKSSVLYLFGTRPLQSLWMHPEIEKRLNPRLGFRAFSKAVADGIVWPCDLKPWYFLSPSLQDRILGKMASNKGLKKLKQGPRAHERFIFRCLARCCLFISISKVSLDEGIFSESLPSSWSAPARVHPDILLIPKNEWVPRIWIECERTLKRPKYYRSKVERIPRGDILVYIVPSFEKYLRLSRIFDQVFLRPRPRHFFLITEAESEAFFRRMYLKFSLFSKISPQKILGECEEGIST